MKLSIIIPTYNEAANIQKLLRYLKNSILNLNDCEIIVVDGGSSDDTIQKAQNINGITVLSSKKGRGEQMNHGAKSANAETLYFLHADSFPPKHFDKLILEQVNKKNIAGCFRMEFDRKHIWLKLAGWFTQFNLKFFRGGDQSLFIQKKLFNTLGKFPTEYAIFEDFEIIRKLYANNEFTVIQKRIISSSRRYTDNGIAKLQYHYWMMYLKKWFGANNEILLTYYKKNVK